MIYDMITDILSRKELRRGVLYALFLLAALAVQNVLFAQVKVFGIRPMPMPLAVVAVGLFEGGLFGGVFGLFAGIFCDAAFIESLPAFTVVYSLIGFFTGLSADFAMNRRFFPYLLLCVAALILTVAAQMFRFLVFTDTDPQFVLTVAGIQTALSLPFAPAAYLPCKALGRGRRNLLL